MICEAELRAFGLALIALSAIPSIVHADPFDWDASEVYLTDLQFSDGTDVRLQIGHDFQGRHVELAVFVDREPLGLDESDEQIFHEMTDGLPKIYAWQDLMVMEFNWEPWGQDGIVSTTTRCWQSGPSFVEVECPMMDAD